MKTGPYKIFATGSVGSLSPGKRGWYYPIFLDEKEAMKEDIRFSGKGIFDKMTFLERNGEFYLPQVNKILAGETDPIIYEEFTGNGRENKFSRIQNRLSSLIPSQLPDFIQDEYENFVVFLKAYYTFLEQDSGSQELLSNIRQYNDIDKTATELIERFFNIYAEGYIKSSIADNTLVLKKMREIYEKKGTEDGYKMLFNILYGETIEFFYPYSLILKPSDGKWKNERFFRSIRENNQQNGFLFESTSVKGTTSNSTTTLNDVVLFNIGPYEVFQIGINDYNTLGKFVGETIVTQKTIFNESNTLVTANLSMRIDGNLISSIKVLRTGKGYSLGDRIEIVDVAPIRNTAGGTGAFASVKNISPFTRLKEIQILDPGINYSSNTLIRSQVSIVTDVAYFVWREAGFRIYFLNEHDYIKGDPIEIFIVGPEPETNEEGERLTSNLFGQYFRANVAQVVDKFTVRTYLSDSADRNQSLVLEVLDEEVALSKFGTTLKPSAPLSSELSDELLLSLFRGI